MPAGPPPRVKVAHAQIRHLNPLPGNLADVLRRYPRVVLPEMNLGHLALLLRAEYLVDVQSVTKVAGMAFRADEIEGVIDAALDGTLRHRKGKRNSPVARRQLWVPGDSGRGAHMTDLIGSDLGLTLSKTAGVPTTDETRSPRTSPATRRCAGARDAVIRHPQHHPQLPARVGPAAENIAFVSGIGCSSRFPYYLETYDSLHPRARSDHRDGSGRLALVPICRCGWSPVTATHCPSAATT